ncbi:siderophore-interacting protein [Devosia sp. SL43]|uniref:siderophore-interacting protein n=1 Tax=Devosia sp. SL43 TaxID=2806348 RepID=UPI001F3066DB|nr:siderophore-interacting protein [Devosia sp. SL43]UJW84091.1 siderophore-interacting protein [Devosia sp. SL43]
MSETVDPRAIRRHRHETRMRLLEVVAVTDITPLMRRFRLGGDMAGFASLGHADHIKAFFFPEGVEPALAPIGPNGAEWVGERPQMRDYTPRQWDVAAGWIDLDFVLHGDGPASSWAATANVGSKLVIGGPRGSQVVPAAFDWYLLAGDETALPAIGRRIEELPTGSKVIAIIEVADAGEEQSFETSTDLSLTYVHRYGAAAGTTSLILDAIKATRFPDGTAYAYLAGESTMSKAVREHLTSQRGFNPEYVKAAGYWLLGVADAQEPH